MKAYNIIRKSRSLVYLLSACGLSLSSAVLAAPGTLATDPLFIGNAVKSNIILPVDTSGSMDFEVSIAASEGALWWHTTAYTFVGKEDLLADDTPGQLNFHKAGNRAEPWRQYFYIFPNGYSSSYDGRRLYRDTTLSNLGGFAIPPTINYAFARSSAYNKAYYDPSITYDPWVSYSTTFNNADPAAARFDPIDTPGAGLTTLNLLADLPDGNADDSDWTFRMYKNMVIPNGTRYKYTASNDTANGWDITSSYDTAGTGDNGAGATGDIKVQTDNQDDDHITVAIPYYPATYYVKVTTGTYSIDTDGDAIDDANGDCSAPNPAHYLAFHDYPSTLTVNTGTFHALGTDGACLKTVKIESAVASYTGSADRTDCAAAPTCTFDEEKVNFANWFQYYRNRHLAMRGSMVSAFEGITGVNVNAFSINHRSTLTMRDIDTERNDFYGDIYGLHGEQAGTPNRQAVFYAGEQLGRTASPIVTEPCQKNFTILFTDGYSQANTSSGVGNADNAKGAPYEDTHSNTMADIAMYFYEGAGTRGGGGTGAGVIGDGLALGEVQVNNACPNTGTPTPAWLDCNDDLHMNFYAVMLNSLGESVYDEVTYNNVQDAYATPPTWTNPTDFDAEQVDDLYHACINGRGEFFNATSPTDIETKMQSALALVSNETGAASAIALNTTELNNTTVLYQARFNSENWRGEMLAKDIDENTGEIAASETWDAGDQIPVAGSRTIITFNTTTVHSDGAGLGVAFTTANLTGAALSASAIADLGTSLPAATPCGGSACTASHRLNYLRGDRTYENADNTAFRVRDTDTVLGDIVHSTPVFAGKPELNWPDGTSDGSDGNFPGVNLAYSVFKNNLTTDTPAGRKDRQTTDPMVYFGANDGMLHGVNANDGVERLAYIPNSVFSNAANSGLHYLSEPGYVHRYYVDLSPSISDVFTKGRANDGTIDATRAWRTILVGGLRGGGKGFYALDITDPDNFSEANAEKLALWEFTSSNDSNLGNTFSKPTIVPTNAVDDQGYIRWAAIFGNGYNNGGDCHAELFIVFLDAGDPANSKGGFDGTWTFDTTDTNYDTTDYIRIDTETGSGIDCSGLSTPLIADLNNDGKADRVYAGDIKGKMWAFDICNETAGNCQSSGWDVAYQAAGNPAPLYTATDSSGNVQPIMVKPSVVRHPTIATVASNEPNVLVLFGTGQYLIDGDKTDTTTGHSFYGVWDNGTGNRTLDRAAANPALVGQSMATYNITDTNGDTVTVRVMSGNSVAYDGTGANQRFGWYIDLPDAGSPGANERVIVDAKVRGNLVFFNTAVPTASGCDVGGRSWLMSVDITTGGLPSESVFDVDSDGTVDTADLIDTDGDGTGDSAASGRRSGPGLASSPSFAGSQRLVQYSTGETGSDETRPTGVENTGRFSWKELTP